MIRARSLQQGACPIIKRKGPLEQPAAIGLRSIAAASVLMAASSALAPLIDALSKGLVESYAVVFVVWMRFMGHTVLAGLAVLFRHRSFRPLRPSKLQFLRGAAQFVSSLALVWSLRYLSLATALILVFSAPLLVIVFRRICARPGSDLGNLVLAGAGFAGVFLVYLPAGSADPLGVALAVAAALTLSLCFLLTGVTASRSDSLSNSFHVAFPSFLLGLPLILFGFELPELADLGSLLALGLLSALCHALISAAMRTRVSSAVTPIAYLEIPFAMFYGFLLFAQPPRPEEVAGGCAIVAAGLAIAFRLRRGELRTLRRFPLRRGSDLPTAG